MIEPRLDPATFDGVADRTAFLRNAWAGLATAVHLSDEGGIGFKEDHPHPAVVVDLRTPCFIG